MSDHQSIVERVRLGEAQRAPKGERLLDLFDRYGRQSWPEDAKRRTHSARTGSREDVF